MSLIIILQLQLQDFFVKDIEFTFLTIKESKAVKSWHFIFRCNIGDMAERGHGYEANSKETKEKVGRHSSMVVWCLLWSLILLADWH